jgi:hypothetical protein
MMSSPPSVPYAIDHRRGHLLFLVVLIGGARRRLTVLVRGNIVVTGRPLSHTGVVQVALSNLHRSPCLVEVLLLLESVAAMRFCALSSGSGAGGTVTTQFLASRNDMSADKKEKEGET